LGRPVGTIVSRLVRARQRLRARLSRRGVTLAVGGLAAALAENGAPAAVPGAQVGAAVRAAALAAAGQSVAGAVSSEAAVLAQGVIRTMLYAKVKVGAAVVLAAVLLGGGVFTYGTKAGQPPAATNADKAGENSTDEQDKLRQLQQQLERQQRLLEEKEREIRTLRERAEALNNLLQRMQAQVQFTDEKVKTMPKEPARPPEPRFGNPAGREHTERVLQAKEEVELLEVQLHIKEAQLRAERRKVDNSQRRLQQLPEVSPEKPRAYQEMADQAVQLEVKEAELKEPLVRLAQARRRLEALVGAGQAPQNPHPVHPEQRQRELEKRLDVLGKELEALRRELKGQQAK
jgi:hypothetical protein